HGNRDFHHGLAFPRLGRRLRPLDLVQTALEVERAVVVYLLQQKLAPAFQYLILAILALLGAFVARRVTLVATGHHAGPLPLAVVLFLDIDRDDRDIAGGLAKDILRLGARSLELFLHLGRELHQRFLRRRFGRLLVYFW